MPRHKANNMKRYRYYYRSICVIALKNRHALKSNKGMETRKIKDLPL
jgi:hypothetical protein